MTRARSLLATAIVLLVAGCGNDTTTPTTTTAMPDASTTTTGAPSGAPPRVKLTTVATVSSPVAMAQRDGDDTLYVAEKTGRIRAVRDGLVDSTPILDLSNTISAGGEQGLLGFAFAPGKPLLYVDYTDQAGDTHIDEFGLTNAGLADPNLRREILFQKQPAPNHNGGQLTFGPDGLLYIGLGDGGGSGDPNKNGQNLTVLLGKILRINPTASKDLPYTIPFDNPFAKRNGARGEIWAYGLRNPWRFSFDKQDKSMWIADVGQDTYEEINHVPADPTGGQNYGWSLREGTHEFSGDKPKDAVDPVHEYDHKAGDCSVTGGYVYRGTAIPNLASRYVFGDYCSGRMWTLTQRGTSWAADEMSVKVPQLTSFGEDRAGNLYALSQTGQVSRIDVE